MNTTVTNPIGSVIETARMFDTIREVAPNRSTVVDFFNWWVIRDGRDYPLGAVGAPWCATFVATVMRLALGAASPVPLTPSICDVDKVQEWGQENGIFRLEGPRRGDIFVVRHWLGGEADWVHTGFVSDGVGSDEHFETIEGNTNDDGSDEGNGVYVRRRQDSQYIGYVRWSELLT